MKGARPIGQPRVGVLGVVSYGGARITPGGEGPLRDRHDLSRIHNVVGIERALDGRHGHQRRLSQLAGKIFHLALPDAVLTGAGAVHGKRALDQPLAQYLRGPGANFSISCPHSPSASAMSS
jgi:hypothetical protein